MSYSFGITATSKADAVAQVEAKFDEVVANQPTHQADKDAVVNTAAAFIEMMHAPNDGEQITVSVHGSLGWRHADQPPTAFISGNVNVSVSLTKKS